MHAAGVAVGVLRRKGLGKMRHLNLRYLWLEDRARTGTNLAIAKIYGLENPADIVVKYLNSDPAQGRLEMLRVTRSCGRAASAPVLAAVALGVSTPAGTWQQECSGGKVVRVKEKVGRTLLTPLRVKGAP